MKQLFVLLLLSLSLLQTGCDKKSISTQPSEVHWDRDMCARCAMVVSDRENTTQVINPANGKVYMFDDIGCMILWFDDEKIPWKDKAVIWITDAKTGKWIDARKAFYDTENITPMAYGFSAHKTKDSIAKDQEIIDYNEVVKRVRAIGR
jgi:nitrous oxide reductase accessory protein NosL